MMRVALYFVLFGVATGCSESEKSPSSRVDEAEARALGDAIAESLINDRRGVVWSKMEKRFRDGTTEAEFVKALDQMHKVYGQPKEVEYKANDEGMRFYTDGTSKPQRKVWYAVETTLHPKGSHFLTIETVPDGGRLAVTAIQILKFVDGIPARLK